MCERGFLNLGSICNLQGVEWARWGQQFLMELSILVLNRPLKSNSKKLLVMCDFKRAYPKDASSLCLLVLLGCDIFSESI